MKYASENEPVAPRYDVNAPDLYIPAMAILTYVLISGFALGTQHRYSVFLVYFLLEVILAVNGSASRKTAERVF